MNGKNLRLVVNGLTEEIDVSKSKHKVKSNSVVISLSKAQTDSYSKKNWPELKVKVREFYMCMYSVPGLLQKQKTDTAL